MPPRPATIHPEALLQHAALVRRLVRALIRDEAAVDDVTQDTLVAALERPPRHPESLHSWLGSVARRFALHRIRREERRGQRERAVARPEATGRAGAVDARELLLENVTRAVLELDEPFKTTVMLRFYEGLGPTQIAKQTGVPLATVASRLRRGLERIRERLDRRTDGGRDAWSATATALAASKGVLFMSSKLKLVAGAAFLALGTLVIWQAGTGDAAPFPTDARAGASPDVALVPAEALSDDVAAETEAPARVAVTAPVLADEGEGEAPTTGSLLLRASWEDTGAPAVARTFAFFPWDGYEPFAERFERVTDGRGEVRLDGLTPGSLMIYGRLGGGGRVEIAAGETTEEELLLPAGMLVTGRVVTPDGRGVAGARVWLSDEKNDEDGQIVVESGADGRFSLRGVGPWRWVAAFAEGHAPALPRQLEGLPGETVEVRLELGPAGGTLLGQVVDEGGAPLADARVRVESLRDAMLQHPDGTWARAFAPWEEACDEAGRFELAGLPVERVRLSVRAPGRAPEVRELEPAATGRSERFVLHPSGVVFGTVRNAAGEPVAGAGVSEGPYAGFASSFGRTRADGRFRLANLPLGPVKLLVEHAQHGRAELELELVPGEPVEWNPTLSAGATLAGTVVDGDGAPRAGFTIDAIGSRPDPESRRLWSEQQRTAADGSFRFANCPDEELTVEVHAPGYVRLQTLRGVRPGAAPLTIVVLAESLPSARLRGTVVGPDGNAVAATLVLVGPEGSGAVHEARCEADTGDFAFGPLPPGTYTLRLKPDDWPELAYGEVELLRDDVLDLGAWRLESPSPIELEVVGPRGSEPGLGPFEEVTLFRDRGDGVWFEPRRYARADLDELLAWPGDYVLCARGATVCSESQPLTVIAGEAARVRLEPDPGVECTLVLVPGTTPLPPRLVLSIVDAQNRSAANWSELDPGAGEQHLTRRLRPGEYTAVLRAHGGEPTRYPFRVHAPHDASRGEPVTIELPLD